VSRNRNERNGKFRIDNMGNRAYNKIHQEKQKITHEGVDSMKHFKQELFELLTIQATSGQEEKVVKYLKPVLETLCNNVFEDAYGNLLAEKIVGDGKGATVVLSAHMDTVDPLPKGRKVLFNNDTQCFTSSKGILGADDRAGIAIILAVLRNIDKTSFTGTIKVCFSREEEIGCVGADNIPVKFYEDAALAIVVDRRGHRDIVTGCGVMHGFCSKEVSSFLEDCSGLLDMNWKACPGGVSDALSFSSNGIHAVNLSAGYNHEHTSKEYVNITHSRDTVNLILQAFSSINSQYHKFGEVPKARQYTYSTPSKGLSTNWGDELDTYDMQAEYDANGSVNFYDKRDTFGNVYAASISGYVSIYQDSPDDDRTKANEVFMDEANFRNMIDQYCLVTGYNAGVQRRNEDAQLRMDRDLDDIINETGDYSRSKRSKEYIPY
jgi:putative aminopeptidase FrvX